MDFMLNTAMTLSERMAYGAKVGIVGMLTVFAVLIILLLVLQLFKLFAYTIPEKKKNAAQKAPEPQITDISTDTDNTDDLKDENELVAVITAAIHAYNAQNGSSLPFRVVSYKRVKGSTGWSKQNNNESI